MRNERFEKDKPDHDELLDRLVQAMCEAGVPYGDAIRQFQATFIERVVQANGAHLGKVSTELHMHPNTLTRQLRRLGINVSGIRQTARNRKLPNNAG